MICFKKIKKSNSFNINDLKERHSSTVPIDTINAFNENILPYFKSLLPEFEEFS